jgi:hypothetical protein
MYSKFRTSYDRGLDLQTIWSQIRLDWKSDWLIRLKSVIWTFYMNIGGLQ